MTSWEDVAADAPDLATTVRTCFDSRKHKTLATLRADGSPRISGIETEFSEGEIWLGMMPGSVKARDVRRDPRIALHSPTNDPPEGGNPSDWFGEAKIAGRAVEVPPTGEASEGHRFRVDVTEVVHTAVGSPADHLVIQSWHPGRGLELRTRR